MTTTGENSLIGCTEIYLKWSTTNAIGYFSYIKIGFTTPTALSKNVNKTWNIYSFTAPTSATSANIVNDKIQYGKGVKMTTSSSFKDADGNALTNNTLLNLGVSHSSGFDPSKGGYIMFKLPANTSGTIKVKHIANTTDNNYERYLTYKIGTADAASITTKGVKLNTSEIPFTAATESEVYFYATASNTNYYIYSIDVNFTSTTIGSAEYITYCNSQKVDFSATGATVYTAKTNTTTNEVELTAVTGSQVPANTGVILYKAGGGDITPNIIAEATAFTGENANNELVGVTAETTVSYGPTDGKYNYIFQKQDDVLGFYKATGAKIRANRAYLSVTVPAASAPQKLNIMINNAGTTAISDEIKVNAEESQEKVYYNLAGQRVANPTKGLYIVNGKKVIIK